MTKSALARVLSTLVFSGFCLMGTQAYASWETSLTSHWPGEHDSFDSLGTNHITPMGTINYGAGKIDTGFILDGGGYLEIPTLEGIEDRNFTFHMWIQPNLDNVREQIIFKVYHTRGDTTVSLMPNGQLCARAQWRHGGCTFSSAPNIFLHDSMIHLTITYAQDTLSLYKNGVLIGAGTGNCCYPFQGSVFIGGESRVNTRMLGAIDEIQFHNHALTATEILEMYNSFIIQNPNPELLAALDEAYEEIAQLETQVSLLTDTNLQLENQIQDVESQNSISAAQIFELEAQIDNLDDQVVQLEVQVETLEDKVSQLNIDIAALQAQIEELKQLVTSLESEVQALELKVNELQAEINQLKQLVTTSLEAIEIDFRNTFKDPDFEIIGDTPEDEMENLVKAITSLKKGHKKALYKKLRTGGYPHKKHHRHFFIEYFLYYGKHMKHHWHHW